MAVEIPRMTDLIRMQFSDFRYFREKFEEKKKKSLKNRIFISKWPKSDEFLEGGVNKGGLILKFIPKY